MASPPSSPIEGSAERLAEEHAERLAEDHDIPRPPQGTGDQIKAFLTTVMGLLSLLVFGLALAGKSTLWLWISFACALISGIFVQILLQRRERNEASGRS